ncbi:nucleotidyltransferase family protein [Rubrimonas cliftonensis]|uniref:Nucleotidyltransferase n=1 Tax=Rubrimonas cliftonensis TaxID=89524 RepID=A0A1H4BDM2_9RHOB|nr:nucleotidyltransferase family protein [Rubrimonas cliftonensis]SEA46253.1 hypothetical protein SAMN05444370_105153 [Rubrimonas cliftonensis]
MSTLEARFCDILRADPVAMAGLRLARDSGLPDCWLVSGALYGAVWNSLSGRSPGYGLKDVDIVYFDAGDPSWEAEDAAIRAMPAALPCAQGPVPVELRNQARTHLWFPRRFGFAYPKLASATGSLRFYASRTHAVAARLSGAEIVVAAPFGLDAIFARRLTPNPVLPNRATHEAKSARIAALWPEVVVEPWPEAAGPAPAGLQSGAAVT